MNIKNLAVQLLMSKMGSKGDAGTAESALSGLIGRGRDFDIGDLVGQFTGSGGELADKAKSWLGDGANESISPSQLQEVIGSDKISAFAEKLGVSRDEASGSLSDLLPQLIDKSSRGGNLLESVGSAGGLASLASKFFK